jgi:hypothetical protein
VIFPVVWRDLFIPVTCHSKVRICIGRLPCVTSQGDKASLVVLQIKSQQDPTEILMITHINAVPQMGKILFEQLDDICTCRFPCRNHNTTGGTSSHCNHFFEGWVLEGLNGLAHLVSTDFWEESSSVPGEFQSTIGRLHLGKAHPSTVSPSLEAVPWLDEGQEIVALHDLLQVRRLCAP